jgi:hypothetical protein
MDRLRKLAVISGPLLLLAVACTSGGGEKPAVRVVDQVRVREVTLPGRGLLGRCLRLTPYVRGRVLVVERAGRIARSVTVTQRGSRSIFACDRTGIPLEGRPWCGFSAGRLRNGQVDDPRLDVLCLDRERRHVGAAFVNPVRGARWIAVDQGSYRELYPVAGGVPVRIAGTRSVDYGRARATFVIAQIGAGGRVLARGRIVAHVAG